MSVEKPENRKKKTGNFRENGHTSFGKREENGKVKSTQSIGNGCQVINDSSWRIRFEEEINKKWREDTVAILDSKKSLEFQLKSLQNEAGGWNEEQFFCGLKTLSDREIVVLNKRLTRHNYYEYISGNSGMRNYKITVFVLNFVVDDTGKRQFNCFLNEN